MAKQPFKPVKPVFKRPFASIRRAVTPGLPPADIVTLRTVLYGDAAAIAQANCDALVAADFIRGGNMEAALELLAKTDADLAERGAFIEKMIAAYGGQALTPSHEEKLDGESADRETALRQTVN